MALSQTPQQILSALYEQAVKAAHPTSSIAQYLPAPPRGRTIVLGAGKAAAAMAHALEDAILNTWPAEAEVSGVVVAPDGHLQDRPDHLPPNSHIEILRASHPVPDHRSESAARKILELAQSAQVDDLVIVLISGGGSALLSMPAEGVSLEEKQNVHSQLLKSGAPIEVMNCVRKHLSGIKGGRLAQACAPAQVITFAISDVPGDDFSVIASGPTVADSTTCGQALAWINHYQISIPAHIKALLENESLETPKHTAFDTDLHRYHMLATPAQSLESARLLAESYGLRAYVLADQLEGESRELGLFHARLAQAISARNSFMQKPCVLLSGGETTVHFDSTQPPHPLAKGGRALEFCMGLTHALKGQKNIWALAADTDGVDGSSDAAGAIVCPDTIQKAKDNGSDITDCLTHHLGHVFFEAANSLVKPGPTNTNVNDFRAIMII